MTGKKQTLNSYSIELKPRNNIEKSKEHMEQLQYKLAQSKRFKEGMQALAEAGRKAKQMGL